ncbi:MAG: ATP-grasp domain-containing protein [Deltaproteobacteria bacterium]|nr:ATP-grasp domain-containing protein [Deltaproteobacteria bacterium]
MNKVLIITGPPGDAQGWGDLKVTEAMCEAIKANGHDAEIAYVESMDEFKKVIAEKSYDIVWSALYHISSNAEIIGMSEDDDAWLADYFDAEEIPYIGPDSLTMKQLIQKHWTHQILKENKIKVPYHYLVDVNDPLPDVVYPAFIKPSTESRSVGISDDSVANTPEELEKQIKWVQEELGQPALVEEYLPGEEYTVLMLGNGERQEFLTCTVHVDAEHYKKYPILRSDLRGVGITKMHLPTSRIEEAITLCKQATDILKCWDHVRVDMRVDGNGDLKIIEVNGIPGLKPIKSWSPQIYTLYHPSADGELVDYQNLMAHIVDSALARYNLI